MADTEDARWFIFCGISVCIAMADTVRRCRSERASRNSLYALFVVSMSVGLIRIAEYFPRPFYYI